MECSFRRTPPLLPPLVLATGVSAVTLALASIALREPVVALAGLGFTLLAAYAVSGVASLPEALVAAVSASGVLLGLPTAGLYHIAVARRLGWARCVPPAAIVTAALWLDPLWGLAALPTGTVYMLNPSPWTAAALVSSLVVLLAPIEARLILLAAAGILVILEGWRSDRLGWSLAGLAYTNFGLVLLLRPSAALAVALASLAPLAWSRDSSLIAGALACIAAGSSLLSPPAALLIALSCYTPLPGEACKRLSARSRRLRAQLEKNRGGS